MCIAAVVIIIFFIPYTASGFAACGKLFSTLFGVNYIPAMVISAIVIVLYTAMGGFLAASTTDLIQGIVMSIALLIIVFFGIHIAGGFDAVMDNARSMTGYLSLTMNTRSRQQDRISLRLPDHLLHIGVGIGLFRYAPYSAALHGD